MLRYVVGDEQFKIAIHDFLARYPYDNVESNDFEMQFMRSSRISSWGFCEKKEIRGKNQEEIQLVRKKERERDQQQKGRVWETNKVIIIDRNNKMYNFELKQKEQVAQDIVDVVEKYLK